MKKFNKRKKIYRYIFLGKVIANKFLWDKWKEILSIKFDNKIFRFFLELFF